MTDTKTLTRETTPDPPPEHKKLLDMSATQLVGGALAAMTSAVIGAQLGVAGTVIGAAVGSLVAGVAGSLYTASLKHTKDKLTTALVGKVGETPVALETVSDDTLVSGQTLGSEQTLSSGSTVVSAERGYGQTWHWDAPTRLDSESEPTAAVAPVSTDPVAADVVVDDQGHTVKQWPWKGILVSTAAVFLLAIAGITGYELISGQSVSGGEGTTIGQVSEGRSGDSQPTPSQAPSSTPSSETSSTPSSEPSASSEPSSSATSEPTSEPSGSSEPTQSSDPSASSERSSSVTASPAAGDANAADSGDAGAVAGS